MTDTWIDVAALTAVPEMCAISVVANGKEIALYEVDEIGLFVPCLEKGMIYLFHQIVDEPLSADLGKAGNVVDRLFGIERGALAAGIVEPSLRGAWFEHEVRAKVAAALATVQPLQ